MQYLRSQRPFKNINDSLTLLSDEKIENIAEKVAFLVKISNFEDP